MDVQVKVVQRDPVFEIAIEAIGLLDQQNPTGMLGVLALVCFVKNRTIAVKPVRPALLAVSTSTYSWRRKTVLLAYSRRSLSCAGIEKPSFSCSLEDTRAYRTAVGGWVTCGLGIIIPQIGLLNGNRNDECWQGTRHARHALPRQTSDSGRLPRARHWRDVRGPLSRWPLPQREGTPSITQDCYVTHWSAHDSRRSRRSAACSIQRRIFGGHRRQGLQAGRAGKAGLPPCHTRGERASVAAERQRPASIPPAEPRRSPLDHALWCPP